MELDLLKVIFLLVLSSSLSFQHQFILIQEPKTWEAAQEFCKENHLDLATVSSDEFRRSFKEELAGSNFKSEVWIGLYTDLDSWRWSFQEETLTFNKWNNGEPNNGGGNEECGEIVIDWFGTYWNDAPCSRKMYIFCYNGMSNDFVLVRDTKRTWYEAQSYCRQYYSDLVTVKDTKDLNKLMTMMLERLVITAWIGLFRDSWKWSDGTNFSSTSVTWIAGQPDNGLGNEACGYADSDGRTGDKSCSLMLPFVCNRVMARKIVRLEVKSDINVADPKIQTKMIQQIEQKLKEQGMLEDAEMTWRKQPDGLVFHEKENETEKNSYWEACDIFPDHTTLSYLNETWS